MKVLFVSFFPNAAADFLMAPYVLKAFALCHESIASRFTFDILNFNEKKGIAKAETAICKSNCDILAFSCYTWNIRQVLALSELVDNRIPILYGGPEISLTSYSLFNNIQNQKYFVVGEGERSFMQLLEYLYDPREGLEFALEDGKSHVMKMQTDTLDLASVPSIYAGAFPQDLIRFREIPIETQRGCLYRCKYCNGNKGLKRIRYFPMERVQQDIQTVLHNDPSEIRFIDSMFASDTARACEILTYLLENCRDYVPLTYIEGDAFTINDSILDIAAHFKEKSLINNCDSMTPTHRPQYFTDMIKHYRLITVVGVQSLNHESLIAVSRRYQSAEQLGTFLQKVNARNLLLKMDFILGLPFETLDTYFCGMNALIDNLFHTDHFIAIYVLKIIPNTRLMDEYQKYDITFDQLSHNVISTNAMTEDEYYYAKCITTIIFRLINSPLRNVYIVKCRALGMAYTAFAEEFFTYLLHNNAVPAAMQDRSFDDYYWHYVVFGDLLHADLLQYINDR